MSSLTEIQISVRDMPDVDRKAKCALPIIISAVDHPESPGINGTCISVCHRGALVFITAGHVLRAIEGTRIVIPLGFGPPVTVCQIHKVIYAVPAEESYESACDVAAMIPVSEPRFAEGETEPLDLVRSLFATAGYPRSDPSKNAVDYDLRRVSFNLFHAVGTYVGPLAGYAGLHTLDLSAVEVGGPQGLSGSPVFRCLLNADGSWTAAFAGMVTMGGDTKIQFVDVAWLARFLLHDVFHDSSIELRWSAR